ncbi:MAG: hypothetical protein PHQ36_07765 [Anaerolineales bacterium]|nr:hypothetical protein [Anaerolineales bacterium]
MNIKKLINLYPRLILRRIRQIIRSRGFRKPESRYFVLALSGNALMIWTISGYIVVSSTAARNLARNLENFADIAEAYNP